MKHDFEDRKARRIDSAQQRAKKNRQEAESLYKSASDMASHIPFGQPILTGHHSEKRDRNYRDKIHNTFGKSFEKQDKAAYYEAKAEIIEQNDTIFSDDPKALKKLREKLKSLQDNQEFMKAANKCLKKKDKEGFLKLPNATVKMWEELTAPDVMGFRGFAPFSLRNNSANIRQVQQRIKTLEIQEEKQAADVVINGVRILENKEAGRLQMIFEGKPAEEIRKKLKSNGFRWSPSQNAWQRHISRTAFITAKQIAETLTHLL